MIAVLNYLRLPAAVSAFEEDHLATMNQVGLWFYLAHVPVFTAIAWFNGTGAVLAAVLTTFTAVGPWMAWKFLRPRSASIVMGFTAMIMGGILVHFGQGPLQIEMHFYFFVLLAMLSTFGNPMVVLVAAVTAAVHHALLWLLLPSSIFNYDASIWVVAVHALFVVLESTASVFLARKFFDNVIGLEKIILERTAQLEERNRAVQVLLDNAGEGFMTLDADARIAPERSVAVEAWLGTIHDGETLRDVLARLDEDAADWFEIGWDSLKEAMLPMEVLFQQLPQQLTIHDRYIALSYKAVEVDGDVPTKVMVVMSDVTSAVEREKAEALAKETMELFQRILADRSGFLEFYAEAGDIMRSIVEGGSNAAVEKRELHTLKGNAGLYGIRSIVQVAHVLETELEEGTAPMLTQSQRDRLFAAWEDFRGRLEQLLGDSDDQGIEIDDTEYEAILRACSSNTPHDQIAHRIRLWKLEPSWRRLDRVKLQAQGIANRLNKTHVEIDLQPAPVRLDAERWAPFWGAFVHAIRNAVDHGVESVSERTQSGKSHNAHLSIQTTVQDGQFVVTLADDGRGIDWEHLKSKAEELGVEVPSGDLTELLFMDGLSTRDEASETSGRGVGMAALREATQQLGGDVHVQSQAGQGTTFAFSFPVQTVEVELRRAA